MDIRAQIGTVFHTDKCMGCHTCSIACKNIWTDRKGAEYMWWNNVETKPGTGYPTLWEDQSKYQGGWVLKNGQPALKGSSKARGFLNIFYNPYLPTIDDYYEPWTYRYKDLYNAPAGDDQPTARAVSLITGEEMYIESGPNWDDDMSGTPVYAKNDYNASKLTDEERKLMLEFEKIVFFYLPRICNHCLNPACVASCPSGAIYKRGEDGIVLINQDKCRGWRFCVSGCPYKKSYYNWGTGKSEKCILCYPRQEAGEPPACFHACPGRIRYLGVLLYDADKIADLPKVSDDKLIDAQLDAILDPHDPEIIAKAKANGISDGWIQAAQQSPTYKLIKEYKIALPLHAEFRTIPMLFYIPPLLPVVGTLKGNAYDVSTDEFYATLDNLRLPMKYMASLFTAGDENKIREVFAKLYAVRNYMRNKTVGDLDKNKVEEMLTATGTTAEDAEGIYFLEAMANFKDRMVVPPFQNEYVPEEIADPKTGFNYSHAYDHKAEQGIGYLKKPRRGA